MKLERLKKLIYSINLMENRKFIYLGVMSLSLIAVSVAGIISPIMNRRIINAIEFKEPSLFYSAIVLLVIVTTLYWVFLPIGTYLTAWASKRAMYKIRRHLYEHIIKLPTKYYDIHSTGDVLSLFSNDLNCLERIYDYEFYQVLSNFCIGFTGVIMLFVIDWRIAMVAFLMGMLSIFISHHFNKPFSKIGAKIQESAGRTTTVFLDIVRGIQTIKLFGIGGNLKHKLDERLDKETAYRVDLVKRQGGLNTILGVLNGLSSLGIIIIGGYMVNLGWIDWGSVIVVSGLHFATGDLFSKFPQSLANLSATLAGVDRIINVFSKQKEKVNNNVYKSFPKEDKKILELEGISFGYNNDNQVISDFSLTLNRGEIIVITGASGCGKSTLIKLIMGLYTPTNGVIKYYGNKSTFDLFKLREQTAYVPQNAQLFADTIYENIACGTENATLEEVINAAKKAGIHDYIKNLPQGYQTKINNDGKSLSGGQRQRIAIARALIKDADILLLDEITSSLDGKIESQIMQTIQDIAKNKAVLLISHRDTTISYGNKNISL